MVRVRVLVVFVILFLGMLIPCQELNAQCVANPVSNSAYAIFVHNSGYFSNCVQDYDLDVPEWDAYKTSFATYLATRKAPIVGDYFENSGCAAQGKEAHGIVVTRYVNSMSYHDALEVDAADYSEWAEMVNDIAETYPNQGRVVNLSTGLSIGPSWYEEWDMDEINAICAAYDSGLVLSGPSPVWIDHPKYDGLADFGDKVLMSMPMNSMGELCNYNPDPDWVNACYIAVPTNWDSGTTPNIARQTSSVPTGLTQGYENEGLSGSFTSGLLSGSVQYVADIVYERGYRNGAFVDRVLDYVLSSCDRNDDPESYVYGPGQYFYPRAPWSPIWGYGVYNPWKAMIYAYGFGRLEARDSELDFGNSNPMTVFSDNFLLRGDLFVPSGQAFRVNEFASIKIDPDASVPEGPADLGFYTTLHEVKIAGDMEVAASNYGGVSATVVIDSGGSCTVEDGGVITIYDGFILHVRVGGQLDLEQGGEIIIKNGGKLKIEGDFNQSGLLTLHPGSDVEIWDTATLYLESDVYIPVSAHFCANYYHYNSQSAAEITVADADVAASGNDPARVEIVCEGRMSVSSSDPQHPIVIKGETSGSGTWAGICFDSDDTNPSIICGVEISDAVTGLEIGGSSFVYLANMHYSECGTGLKATGKSQYLAYIIGGEATDCSYGVDLVQSSLNISGMSIYGNDKGIRCSSSSPKVRGCHIYDNDIGVLTLDSGSVPDLGTVADPGGNDFHGTELTYPGLANDIHISAMDPTSDIYAQNNWWGTTNTAWIEARIVIIDAPPAGAGSVVYAPILTLPLGAPSDPGEVVGKEEPVRPIVGGSGEIPMANYLDQNFPNPFNPATTIAFGLESSGHVDLRIYDATGRLVRTLLGEKRSAGRYEEVWNGNDDLGRQVSSGIYFYRLKTAAFTETRKMVLLR